MTQYIQNGPFLLIYYDSVSNLICARKAPGCFPEKFTRFSAKRPFLKVFSENKTIFYDPRGSVATREGPETSGGLTRTG